MFASYADHDWTDDAGGAAAPAGDGGAARPRSDAVDAQQPGPAHGGEAERVELPEQAQAQTRVRVSLRHAVTAITN